MAKDIVKHKVECPNCGEIRETERAPTRRKGGHFDTYFCSLVCETNYRYRQSRRNRWIGKDKSAEDVRRL